MRLPEYRTTVSVDISGEGGTPENLIALARLFGDEHVEDVIADMTSGSYQHLVETFDRHYHKTVTLTA